MKRFVLFLAAAVMVSTVVAGFKYEGEWDCHVVEDVDVAPNGNVYINAAESEVDELSFDVRYYTPIGSFLGSWPDGNRGVAVAPNGNVYTGGCWGGGLVNYYTPTGSLLGSWGHPLSRIRGGDIASDGTVYVSGPGDGMLYYTPTGSLLGSWKCTPGPTAISNNNVVYIVAGSGVQYFTSTGSHLGSWVVPSARCVAVAPNGEVFVTTVNADNFVRRYNPSGSLIEAWGSSGSGPGEFQGPNGIAVSPDGIRVYVADTGNRRIQYFNRNVPAVSPTSLGKVKALFR
jgi:sugar lactone lactonase YvrE